jgi:hypothetical protein
MSQPLNGRAAIRLIKDVALIVFFLTALCLPVIGLRLNADVGAEQYENRRLAGRPQLSLKRADLAVFPEKFKAYFSDNFGFRRALIRLQALVRLRLLGDSPSSQVIIGKSGWYFLASEYSANGARLVRPLTTEELERWRRILEGRRDWLAQRRIHYLFVITPSKETIYPEYLPNTFKRDGESRLEQLTAYLKSHSNLEVLDLRPILRQARSRHEVFYRTDAHVNFYGGFAASRAMIDELRRWFPQLQSVSESDYEESREKRLGNLTVLMGISGDLLEDVAVLKLRNPTYETIQYQAIPVVKRPTQVTITEKKGSGLPRAVIFHDSSAAFYIPFLPQNFSRAVFVWLPKLDPQLIKSEHPDVVIQQMGELLLTQGVPTDLSEIETLKSDGSGQFVFQVKPGTLGKGYTGVLNSADCERIVGWAWDRDNPVEPQNVEIYDGAKRLGIIPANIFRKDLVDGGIGNGNFGFTYQTPQGLRDAKPHWIMVKIAGTDYVLADPQAVTCSGQ